MKFAALLAALAALRYRNSLAFSLALNCSVRYFLYLDISVSLSLSSISKITSLRVDIALSGYRSGGTSGRVPPAAEGAWPNGTVFIIQGAERPFQGIYRVEAAGCAWGVSG